MPGIELDADLGPLQVVGQLGVELGRMNDRQARSDALAEKRHRDFLRTRTPIDVRLFTSGVCPTPTAPFGMSLDGPDHGFYWLVRRLLIGGVSWATVAAGSAEVYISGIAGIQGGVQTSGVASIASLSDMTDQSATLPSKAYYSNHQLVVQPNETLMVVIRTGTQAQTYVAAAQIEVHRTIAAGEEFTA